MSIEQEVFRRRTVRLDALVPFGFEPGEGGYRYAEAFLDGEFRAVVRIDSEGRVHGTVTAADSGEEYLPLLVESSTGAFVGEVREQYRRILERIAGSCTTRDPFDSAQGNRIARLIRERLGEEPDFPFKDTPGCGVFRFPKNRKWYGIVMHIRKSLLTRTGSGDEETDVLNVKADADAMDELLAVPGIFPGYHMNRAHWISILLDGTVPDGLIMRLLEQSREFASRGGRKVRAPGSAASWIIPANPRFCDIEPEFKKKTGILWKQGAGIRTGDAVFIYMGSPVSAIRYKCLVTETAVPYEYDDGNIRMKQAMKMDLLEEYPVSFCTAARMRELDIRSVRGPRAATEAFLEHFAREGNIRGC